MLTPDALRLTVVTTFNATITLLNTQVSPADTISKEVLEEGTKHQFFYQSSTNALSRFHYLAPNDDNGNPFGLNFDFDTWNWK